MSFKSYLQSLIDALLKKSVENTSPSPALYSEVSVTTSGERILSPIDGFVRVDTLQVTKADNYLTVGSESVAHQHTTEPGFVNRLDLPVKKGSYVRIDFAGCDVVSVGFVARVGGGAKGLLSQALRCVRGGGLCLKTSLEHSLNRCLLTRRATLRLSACQVGATLYKRLQSNRGQQLFLTTDGHVFKRIAIVYKRALSRLVLLLLAIKTTRGRQSYCQSKRVNTYNGTFLKTFKAKCLFGLFKIKRTNSLTAKEVCHA